MWKIVVVTRRTEEDINQRPKRLFEENNITLEILVYVPSRAMLKQHFLEVNNDLPPQKKKHHVASNKTQSVGKQTDQICTPTKKT